MIHRMTFVSSFRHAIWTGRHLLAVVLIALTIAPVALGSGDVTVNEFRKMWTDASGDQSFRPTGSVSAPWFDLANVDLQSLTIRFWSPESPANPFAGVEVTMSEAHVFKLELVIDGLVNPPGPLGLGGHPWDPDRFGPRPVFGSIELDVDDRKNSGGELEPIALNRYLANVARFGGLPESSFGERAAKSADDYDGAFFSGPQFERTGAEFALALCGCFAPTLVQESGDNDGILEVGESMLVRGRFFERMQAVAPFAGAFGGSDFGLYDPEVNLRFTHDAFDDVTRIEFVYPLDQTGAATLTGQAQQSMDFSVLNHTSVAEALNDLIFTANGFLGPVSDPAVYEMIEDWEGRSVSEGLDIREWNAIALLGASYMQQGTALYVWTDTGFDSTFGDLTTDGVTDSFDAMAIDDAILTLDGSAKDADGLVNGVVQIVNFGPNFNLHDINSDGLIDNADVDALPTGGLLGDLNGDGFVNGADLAALLAQWGQPGAADLNNDGAVDGADLATMLANWSP